MSSWPTESDSADRTTGSHSLGEPLPRLSKSKLWSASRLSHRRGRDESGLFLVEGAQAVREALRRPEIVEGLIVDDEDRHRDLIELIDRDLVWTATESDVAALSSTVTSQGVFAVCHQLEASWDDLDSPKLVVICAQVRDPGNAGTVIRCADAFGADAVIFTKGSVELHNPKTVRASVGSIFHMPILTGIEFEDAVAQLKAAGLQVLAADGGGDSLDELAASGDLATPTAWIMGNEAWGLPAEEVALADRIVGVPMWGQAESLNLSTAAAVCLYATASAQRA